jgi:hypothetical protein
VIVSLKRMIAPPTSRIVAVCPAPQSAPTAAARPTDRDRVTIVETATTWSGSAAWRTPRRKPSPSTARNEIMVQTWG